MILAAALLLQAASPPADDACRREEHVGAAAVARAGPDRECRSWRAPRRHTGVWLYRFEGSEFIEGAKTIAEARRVGPPSERAAWMGYNERTGISPRCRPVLGQAYLIDFEGRDSVPPAPRYPIGGGFGHMGLWSSAVLIDHVHASRLLGALPGDQVRPLGVVPVCTP